MKSIIEREATFENNSHIQKQDMLNCQLDKPKSIGLRCAQFLN